ncbi:MAG: cation transporter [Mycobacteriaceae bacterium]
MLQLVVVLVSSSAALLGDTLHNFADALTAVPLAIAFTLGRRVATRRFTYGYGRAEDLRRSRRRTAHRCLVRPGGL